MTPQLGLLPVLLAVTTLAGSPALAADAPAVTRPAPEVGPAGAERAPAAGRDAPRECPGATAPGGDAPC